MLYEETLHTIAKAKISALQAIYLHEHRVKQLRRQTALVDFLSIAVPVCVISVQFLTKGTSQATFVELAAQVLALVLLVVAIARLVYKWDANAERHGTLIARNREIVLEANSLMNDPLASDSTVALFLQRVKDLDDDDGVLLLDAKSRDVQTAYRVALRQFSPSKVTICPVCGANPWQFKKGSCQACGGTPVTEKNVED